MERLSRPDTALELYKDASRIYAKSLGSMHPVVARVKGRIGGLHQGQGRSKEALDEYAGAVEILKSKYGDGHRDVGLAMCSAAAVLCETGR
jgi:hypothetical protein